MTVWLRIPCGLLEHNVLATRSALVFPSTREFPSRMDDNGGLHLRLHCYLDILWSAAVNQAALAPTCLAIWGKKISASSKQLRILSCYITSILGSPTQPTASPCSFRVVNRTHFIYPLVEALVEASNGRFARSDIPQPPIRVHVLSLRRLMWTLYNHNTTLIPSTWSLDSPLTVP